MTPSLGLGISQWCSLAFLSVALFICYAAGRWPLQDLSTPALDTFSRDRNSILALHLLIVLSLAFPRLFSWLLETSEVFPGKKLTNASGRHVAVASARRLRPGNVAELQKILRDSDPKAKRLCQVKVQGAGYSASSVAMPDEENAIALDMSAFDQIGEPVVEHSELEEASKFNSNSDLSHQTATITVGAGVPLYRLQDKLRGTGWRVAVAPIYGRFSVGAIAGTGLYDSSIGNYRRDSYFSSHVVAYEMVLADGRVREVSEEDKTGEQDDDSELMRFLRNHQGMLGVVYEVKLRLYRNYMLQIDFRIFDSIDSFVNASWETDPVEKVEAPNRRYFWRDSVTYGWLYIDPFFSGVQATRVVAERHTPFIALDPITGNDFETQMPPRFGFSRKRTDWFMFIYWNLLHTVWDYIACRIIVTPWCVKLLQYGVQVLFTKLQNLSLFRDGHKSFVMDPCDRSCFALARRDVCLCDMQVPISNDTEMVKSVLHRVERFSREFRTCKDNKFGATEAAISIFRVPQSDRGAGFPSKSGEMLSLDWLHYGGSNPGLRQLETEWVRLARDELKAKPAINKMSDEHLKDEDFVRIYGVNPRTGVNEYERFRALCRKMDPNGRFRNDLLRRVFRL